MYSVNISIGIDSTRNITLLHIEMKKESLDKGGNSRAKLRRLPDIGENQFKHYTPKLDGLTMTTFDPPMKGDMRITKMIKERVEENYSRDKNGKLVARKKKK